MAFRKCDRDYSMPRYPIYSLEATMCQHDFRGERLFQHRNLAKWSFAQKNLRIHDFWHEDLCISFLETLRNQWDGRPMIPKPYEPREKRARDIAESVCRDRYLYERIGYDRREMTFDERGLVAEGSADCETFWRIDCDRGRAPALILSSEHEDTCRLRWGGAAWEGSWQVFERMPVRLTPL